jgi:predicted TIM-barrel fold metal-dependent hydrolase
MDSTSEFLGNLAEYLHTHAASLVIDADAHATDMTALSDEVRRRNATANGYYHGRPVSAEDLIREMDAAEVDMALIWQNPAATRYTDDPERNAAALTAANLYVRDAARRFPTRFIPAGWTDPKSCGVGRALEIAETCVRDFGCPIVKMNPAQNRYRIDSPEVLAVVDRIVELGAAPAFHFGADTPYTPAEGLARVAERYPMHPILGVHMGGGGASYTGAERTYQAARQLGLARPNIRFALSAKRDAHIESDIIAYQLAGAPFCRNLFCASDAPYGRMAWNFGGYRWMFKTLIDAESHTDERVRSSPGLFTPEVAQGYMGGNFARFAAAACRGVLERHDIPITADAGVIGTLSIQKRN